MGLYAVGQTAKNFTHLILVSEADQIKASQTSYQTMDYRLLEGNEAADFILQVLREAGRPLTTREVQAETEKRRARCPDSTAVFLNRLRTKGLIRGERSKERQGWIWWIDDYDQDTTLSQSSRSSTQPE